ncbi:hypothetical protein PV08_02659 [Exophiala spinifera]|uniref:AB hydrolase-1 domain-containing protein n=1 Tax=Exophiala spinifera TaxID=91928 RepID=A0A0D1YSV7_9EURO|nr:uncharacterized protein PV08_02659 [Exophiala spinifera]KIW18371.1 hypothetical protein PV08_02659 [Exophiala spinifera]
MSRTDVEFKTSDNVTLRGWFFTPSKVAPGTELPCVILSHGVSCVKEMGLGDVAAKYVSDMNIACLVYDYRGFGASDTAPHMPRQEINTWLQANDIRDAITYLQMRDDVDKAKIVVWGYSLGAMYSVYVAGVDRRVKAVVAIGPGMSGDEICKRLAPPHALNAMQGLFEMDRIARVKGGEPIKVPVVSIEGGQCLLPSPESTAFFREWIGKDEERGWRNELTLRSLDDLSTYATPMAHLGKMSPTPVFFGVAARDTNSPPDMVMKQYQKLTEPKEYAIVDADHYELMGKARDILHPREVAFLKKWLSLFGDFDINGNLDTIKGIFAEQWAYPSMLWHPSYYRSNGYANSAQFMHSDGSTVINTSWFKFNIIQVDPVQAFPKKQSVWNKYEWYEMIFHVYAQLNRGIVAFCLNTPEIFRDNLVDMMSSGKCDTTEDAAPLLQDMILAEVVKMYDHAVWTIRDHVRKLEKDRDITGAYRDFPKLHDLARHIIHSCEVLGVACDNVTELIDARRGGCSSPSTNSGAIQLLRCPHNDIQIAVSLRSLRNLQRRSDALKARLTNEINLGFNLVVQSDSSSMKTISLITLAFLPATFVSASDFH